MQFYTDKSLLKRIHQHQLDDLKIYIAQKLFKVSSFRNDATVKFEIDGILCNEETRMAIIHMAVSRHKAITEENVLENKYG